jgi:hypothetical protein
VLAGQQIAVARCGESPCARRLEGGRARAAEWRHVI